MFLIGDTTTQGGNLAFAASAVQPCLINMPADQLSSFRACCSDGRFEGRRTTARATFDRRQRADSIPDNGLRVLRP